MDNPKCPQCKMPMEWKETFFHRYGAMEPEPQFQGWYCNKCRFFPIVKEKE